MIRVETRGHREPELAVTVTDYSLEDHADYAGHESEFVGGEIVIHPWDRAVYQEPERARQVSITVKSVDFNGKVFENDEYIDYSHMAIVERDDFLNAVLLAFPHELADKR